jgi:hypothetical protein
MQTRRLLQELVLKIIMKKHMTKHSPIVSLKILAQRLE